MSLPTHTSQTHSTLSALELRELTPKTLLNFKERRMQHTRMVSRQCSKSLWNPTTDLVYRDTSLINEFFN